MFPGKIFLDKLIKTFVSKREAFTFQIHLTKECNLKCTHCYHNYEAKKMDLTLNEWEIIIKNIEQFLIKMGRKPRFVLCGGEPLVCPNLFPFIQMILKKWPDVEIGITTNGTINSQEITTQIKKYKIGIQVSLDGADACKHDAIRGDGSFALMCNSVNEWNNASVAVSTLTVLSKRTSTQIREIFQLAKKLQIDKCSFRRMVASGRAEKLVKLDIDKPLNSEETKKAFEDILYFSNHFGVKTSTHGPLWVLIDESLGSHNRFGFDGIVIDSEGYLKVSGATNFRVSNLLQEDLSKCYLEDRLFVDLRRGKIEGCGKCAYYSRCGGDRSIAYATYGSFLAKDPSCFINSKS